MGGNREESGQNRNGGGMYRPGREGMRAASGVRGGVFWFVLVDQPRGRFLRLVGRGM
ncbi:MAG: hypothetical protein ACOX5W_12035 [Bacillota bacterium]